MTRSIERLGRSAGPYAALFALFVVASLWLISFALRVHTFQDDELIYVTQARAVAHGFPGALFDTQQFHLGIERVNELIHALWIVLFDTTGAFRAAKAANAVIFASVVIPVWLLAVANGVGRWWALAPAALSVAVPWAVLATSFLNEPVAYPMGVWAVWAASRAVTDPRVGNDLLAVALALLAALSRTNLLVLVAVLPIAAAVQEARFGVPGGPARTWIVRFARMHAALLVIVAVGATALLVKGLGTFTGIYGTDVQPGIEIVEKVKVLVSHLTMGVGFFPFIVAVPWLVLQICRPSNRRTHAFALVVLAAGLLILYSTKTAFNDERYVAYIAPLAIVAAAVSIVQRPLHPLIVLASGIGFALMVTGLPLRVLGAGGYDYFYAPAEIIYSRVLMGQLALRLPDGIDPETALWVLVIAGSTLCSWGLRQAGRVRTASAAALVSALLVFGVAGARYDLSRYVDGVGEPAIGFDARTFVDRHVPAGTRVPLIDMAGNPFYYALRDLRFFNESVVRDPATYDGLLANLDPRTGRLKAQPAYFLQPAQFAVVQPVASEVAVAAYLPVPVTLYRTSGSAGQARWYVRRADPDGWVRQRRPALVRIYRAGVGQARCLSVLLTAPLYYKGARRYEITGGDRRVTGTLRAGETRTVAVPIARRAMQRGGPHFEVRFAARSANSLLDGRVVSFQLARLALGGCGQA